MKTYAYNDPIFDGTGNLVGNSIVNVTEPQILNVYWDYWYDEMCKKFGKEHVDTHYSTTDCIEDWVIVNWAWQVSDE